MAAVYTVIMGIVGDVHNAGHWGGVLAGVFVASGMLYLNGALLTMFIFVWALAIIVWVRISSSIENYGSFTSFDNVTTCNCNATLDSTQYT